MITFVGQVHDQPFYEQVHDVIAECSRYSLDVQAREAIQLTVNFFILITSMKIYKRWSEALDASHNNQIKLFII
jgi:hypothetical protein